MGIEPLTPDDEIFVRESVLRDEYTPNELYERDEQIEEYRAALKPVIKGERPKNIFLVGQTGVGKTVATTLIQERVKKDQENLDYLDVEFIYLNCKGLNTSYQVAAKLINEFRPPEEHINPTGYPSGMIWDMLYKHLREIEATHAMIVLDEVDSIGSNDDILYKLPRANDNGEVNPKETYVGVIGISNDFTFRDNLGARIKDSLCDVEIHFEPYDAVQLKTILEHRAERAFVSGVIDEGVLELCSAYAADETGSARQALKFLYKSGELARKDGDEQVTKQHVERAEPLVRQSKAESELKSLPNQSLLALYAMLLLDANNDLPAKSMKIYREYERATDIIDANTRSQRSLRDRLGELSMKGFISSERVNMGPKNDGGRYDVYDWADLDAEVIRSALFETTIGERINEAQDQTRLETYL